MLPQTAGREMFAFEVIWGSPSGGLALISVLFPRDLEYIFLR